MHQWPHYSSPSGTSALFERGCWTKDGWLWIYWSIDSNDSTTHGMSELCVTLSGRSLITSYKFSIFLWQTGLGKLKRLHKQSSSGNDNPLFNMALHVNGNMFTLVACLLMHANHFDYVYAQFSYKPNVPSQGQGRGKEKSFIDYILKSAFLKSDALCRE